MFILEGKTVKNSIVLEFRFYSIEHQSHREMINPLMCLTGQDRVAAVEEHFISLHNPNKRGTDYFLLGRQTVCYFIKKKILNRELKGCFPGRLFTTKKGNSAVYMWTTTSCLDIGSLHLLSKIDYRLRTRTYLNMNEKCKTILRIQEHKTLTTFNYWHWAATASRLQTTIASEKALFAHRLQTLFVDNYCQQVKKALNMKYWADYFR